jgi:hypothetical protein
MLVLFGHSVPAMRRGFSARFGKVLVLAGHGVCAVTASSRAAAGNPPRARLLGVVPHHAGQLAPAPIPHAIFEGIRAAGPATSHVSTRSTRARSTSSSRTSRMTVPRDRHVYAVAKEYYDNPGTVPHPSTSRRSAARMSITIRSPRTAATTGSTPYCLTDPAAPERDPDGADREGLARRASDHVFFSHDTDNRRRFLCESASG